MTTGTVKWFNVKKGDGFIAPSDGSRDVFVHISAIERAGLSTLKDGQQVGFDIERGQHGKTSAVNLQALDGPGRAPPSPTTGCGFSD